jgi:hypothetical protein
LGVTRRKRACQEIELRKRIESACKSGRNVGACEAYGIRPSDEDTTSNQRHRESEVARRQINLASRGDDRGDRRWPINDY